MRIGHNPEKKKFEEIIYKSHRVIIPVYIPNSNEIYFENLFSVFKTSINSLINTIHPNNTNITIVNNDCKKEVTDFIDDLINKKKIDKHVKLSGNYGKVHTILLEAKASTEELITIADADVFYYSGWLENTVKVFNNFSKVGVVAPLPMPQLAYYANNSLFFNKILKIKKGKVISDEDLQLFEKSIGGKISVKKNNWFKNQLYLEKNNFKVCIGAGHFVATYRKIVLDQLKFKKPSYVFEDGAEVLYLDNPIDKLGFFRLSTINTFVYHLGNTIPEFINDYKFSETTKLINIYHEKYRKNYISYNFKKIITKIYRKLIKI